VSLYYYLIVLKQAYVVDVPESARPVAPSATYLVAVTGLASVTVILGCFPNLLVGHLARALTAAGW
jgi:NADH-quinone oxidoreductase subunit N